MKRPCAVIHGNFAQDRFAWRVHDGNAALVTIDSANSADATNGASRARTNSGSVCAGSVRVQVDGNDRDRSIDDAGIDPEHESRGDDDRRYPQRRDESTATATI
jgi:hypothetical protein